MKDRIFIKGAKENNLKNIDLEIPRNKLIVFTGVSGSGKTSLAFDTIFAEGQRRYVESLSSYARQFLGQMDKPDVEYIEGLSPAISIDQKTTSHNPRSTVGTVTEIYDYLRLLYARVGTVFCPECGKEITQQSVDQIVDKIMSMPEGSKIMVMAPVIRGRKGEYTKMFESFLKSGYIRVKIDGEIHTIEGEIRLDKQIKHNISVVVDRLVMNDSITKRLTDSVEAALKLAEGLLVIECDGAETMYNTKYACPDCDVSIEELAPRMFSFNSPFGACPSCLGLGFRQELDPDLVVRDKNKTLSEGALNISGWNFNDGGMSDMYIRSLAKHYNFSLDIPYKTLAPEIQQMLLYGNDGVKINMAYESSTFSGQFKNSFEGIVRNLERRYKDTTSEYIKQEIEKFMKISDCPACHGKRLKKEALSVRINGFNVYELTALSVEKMYNVMEELTLSKTKMLIAERILKEIKERLKFLINVGLPYLTLSRSAGSLSGGEAQRIRLATQIGSGLMGVLYILDEPSIGLHQRDNGKLLKTLTNLRDLGNTLIVVEHDEETMLTADHIVDIGPGAGRNGGLLVAQGTAEEIMKVPESITGQYLSGAKKIDIPNERRKPDGRYIEIINAKKNNLQNLDVKIPVGLLTAVTGVSGSGKSSLINQILVPYLAEKLNGANPRNINCTEIRGEQHFDKLICIDQNPIGKTPRSNPATYTGVFTNIRDLFAGTPDARERGYKAGRFSFNVNGGRCETCKGDGILRIEMHFLPDVYVPCEVCHGKRYNRETLQVKYKGKSIYDILEMSVEDAVEFFEHIPQIYNKIKTIYDVGLGYIKLGQSATTLSGGEAQRVKLATELSKRSTGRTLYVLDEPTTGLHIADVHKLTTILGHLVAGGNTVIVIEHNLDIIKISDYIIDLGPEGGDKGGLIIAEGTPEEVAHIDESYTGQFLKKMLKIN